jgi:Ca2+-binding EF-hand superfamily protein
VFRYDLNNDGQVSYDELTNFCTERHFGEMAIQRLHRKKFYSEGGRRRMNCSEFGATLNDALGYIGLKASAELIDAWFSVIDVAKEGWISYEVYFMFLCNYFGGSSVSAQEEIPTSKPTLNEDQEFLLSLANLNPF